MIAEIAEKTDNRRKRRNGGHNGEECHEDAKTRS